MIDERANAMTASDTHDPSAAPCFEDLRVDLLERSAPSVTLTDGWRRDICRGQRPPLSEPSAGHRVACHFPGETRRRRRRFHDLASRRATALAAAGAWITGVTGRLGVNYTLRRLTGSEAPSLRSGALSTFANE